MTSEADARFGYPVVAAALGVQAIAIGLTVTAYPIFIESIERELGASRTQTSFGVPLVVAAGALVSPWVGRAVDQGSPRRVMVTGALVLMLGLMAVSASPGLTLAAAAWVLLVGPGQALLGSIPAMTVLANWFVARRATMIAIAAIGVPLGGGLVPPLGEMLIQSLGWRGALFSMGLIAAGLGIPIVLLGIRKSPEEIGAYPDGASAPPPAEPLEEGDSSVGAILSDRRFWPLAAAFAALLGLGIAFVTHIVPLATERGISREIAVGLLSVAAIGSALGKLVFGVLTDRLGPRNVLAIGVGLQLASWAGIILSQGPIGFVASASCFTLAIAVSIPVQVGYISAIYGRSHFGRATGLLNLFSMAGIFILSPLIGMGFDRTGSYDLPMTLALAWIALPVILLGFLRLEPADQE